MRNVLDNPKAFEDAIKEETLFDYYAEYLATYDAWDPQNRLLIYYEDLLKSPRQTLKTVLNFFSELEENLDHFMENHEKYRHKTLHSYHQQYLDTGGSMSKGDDPHFHSKHLPEKLQKSADQLLQTKFPVLYARYLQCYL